MRESDWLDICSHITKLWPNDPVLPATAVAWFPLIADLEAEDVVIAVQKARLDPDQRFAPTPGVIRTACTPQAGAWADAIPEILRRLRRSQTVNDDGDFDTVAAYIRTLGPMPVTWDPSDTSTRAQLRDWWNDYHRRADDRERHQIALGAATANPRLSELVANSGIGALDRPA